MAGRVLALPDGTWWIFGAWARWYRWHPSDGQWYLCPPPQSAATRQSARPVQQGQGVPELPPHVVPAGPDFDHDIPDPLPFVGQGISADLSARVRATVESAAALPVQDYPHWWALFSSSVPSTVAVSWGVMLWCAAAPVFDSRLDDDMLGLWTPYRAKPLPTVDAPRWLTAPPLEALVGLYAERLRASRVDAAVVVLRTMWAVASALREDVRFRARADALIAVVGATLSNPTMDYGALPYGDQALVQQWVTRVPPNLAPAMRIESSPGDNFRHAYYDLANAVTKVLGDPAEPSYLEPRLVAAALIAADLAVTKRDKVEQIVPWLDPEIRYTVQAVLTQNGHPLRRLWPVDNRLPEQLRANLGDQTEALLAAVYNVDLAWCRLAGGMPARPRGFPVPTAIITEIIGVDRARAAAAAAPITSPPGVAPLAQQYPPGGAQQGASAQPGWGADPIAPSPVGSPGQMPGQPPAAELPQTPADPAGQHWGAGFGLPGGLPPIQPPVEAPGQSWGQPPVQPAAFGMPAPPVPAGAPGGDQQPPGWGGGGGTPASPGWGAPAQPVQEPMAPAAFGMPAQGPEQYGQGQAGPGPSQPPVPGPLAGSQPEPNDDFAVPYTALGFGQGPAGPGGPPGPAGQPYGPPGGRPAGPQGQFADHGPGQGPDQHWSPPPMVSDEDPMATRMDGPRVPAEGQPMGGWSEAPAGGIAPGGEGPPHTRVLGAEQTSFDPGLGHEHGRGPGPESAGPVPPRPAQVGDNPGTRVMSETMVGGILDYAPLPDQPVEDIEPPLEQAARPVTERFGVRFVFRVGEEPEGERDPAVLLDELHRRAGWAQGIVEPAAESSAVAPSVLLVGEVHTGQRRLARMIALTLADAGAGDGAVRTADADDVRGAPPERIQSVLEAGGGASAVTLFERLDMAIMEALDPAVIAEAVRSVRADRPAHTALVATCNPRAYRRLVQDFPELLAVFRVFRLPDLSDLATRLALLHVLADERRVTIDSDALDVVREDLSRLRGPGELVNSRLVEAYLDRACQRHIGRAGGSRDRLVLTPQDFSGVAAEIEPSLRPPGDVDGFLRRLDQMIGLDQVKQVVHGLADGARDGDEATRNLIFVGRPGTGKMTVAGLVGGIYAALGLLDSGHIVACRPVHLVGRDLIDTENRVYAMVEQAMGGVLLIQEAHRLERSPDVVAELLRYMEERRGRFIVVCTSPAAEMDGFLSAGPDFRAMFGEVVEFADFSDRELVQLFQRFAERDLYMLDEELRAELMARFARMRDDESFAYGRTVREMFEQSVARQAARLAGQDVTAATVARLSALDLPESALQRMLGDLHQNNPG
ncbi:MAG: ATPase [Actinomycetia bacterium]|nr:ATPase [Actinomycetes bacterium]